MMFVILLIIGMLCLFGLLQTGLLTVEIVAAVLSPKNHRAAPSTDTFTGPIAIIVPAHNEETVIASTILSLQSQVSARDTILVVADNCTDSTAILASSMGIDVIIRSNETEIGKGFALQYGLSHVMTMADFSVVVMIDADCIMEPGSLTKLAFMADRTQRPVQASYTFESVSSDRLADKFTVFALRLKNHVRPLGCRQLAIACPLTGSGIALPASIFRNVLLAMSDLAEDFSLGVGFTLAGRPPIFCPDAKVTTKLPETQGTRALQQKRWEQGYLSVMIHKVPRLWQLAFARLRLSVFAAALDASIPPLTLLAFQTAALTGVAVLAWIVTGSLVLLAIQLTSLGLLFFGLGLTYWNYGRDVLTLLDLARMPGYFLSKLPMYLHFLAGHKIGWVKTNRG